MMEAHEGQQDDIVKIHFTEASALFGFVKVLEGWDTASCSWEKIV